MKNFFKKKPESAQTPAEAPQAGIDVAVVGDKTPFWKTWKKWLVIGGGAVILIAVIILIIVLCLRKNDGERYASKLAEKCGSTISAAENHAGLSLYTEARCSYLADIAKSEEYTALYESKDTVKISGTHVPEWAIFCETDKSGQLTAVTYCDYTVLKKHIAGERTDGYVHIADISNGMEMKSVLEQLDLEPFSISWLGDNEKRYKFKYCYKDETSGDLNAYVITVLTNGSDRVTAALDTKNNFLANALSAS